MNISLYAILIPVVFYFLIPLCGSLFVGSQWRKFRNTVFHSLGVPLLTYDKSRKIRKDNGYKFFGKLNSFSGNKSAWIKDNNLTVRIDLPHCRFYRLLPYNKDLIKDVNTKDKIKKMFQGGSEVESISGNEFRSLPEGTNVFIIGTILSDSGAVIFSGAVLNPVTVIVFEEDRKQLVPCALWGGRQTNEIWNPVTPWSLGLGSLLSVIFVNIILRNPSFRYFLKIFFTEALLPVLLFFPPGVVFFVLFLYFWKKIRYYKAKRDLLLLMEKCEDYTEADCSLLKSLFSEDEDKKDIKIVNRKVLFNQVLSFSNLILGLVLNTFLCLIILNHFLE